MITIATEPCAECGHPEEQHDCCPLRCAGCGDTFLYHSYQPDVEPCPHDHVEPDDDGLNRRFFVCIDCDKEVRYTAPDENGSVEWEETE